MTGPLYKFIAGVGSRLAGQGNVAVDIELLKARFYAAHSGVGGNVLDKDLLVVGDLIGRIAVLAAAELVLGVNDLDGVVAVNQLERVDAVVGYQQHVVIDCGIIQSVALVRGEGDGDVLVLGGKNMACNLAAAEGGGAVMDRNVDLVHVRLLRLYDRAVEVGREGVGLAGEVADEVLTRQVGLVGVGAAVIAEAIDSPVGEGGVTVGRGHALEAESDVGHDLAVFVDLETEGVKPRVNGAVPVRGHVLHEHLPVVGDAVGLVAVLAAAELVFSPDGVELDLAIFG